MDGGVTTINNEALNGFVDEIEHQFDERKLITEALRAIYERAKTAGFVPEFLRTMVKERQMAADDRKARYDTLDEYRRALGLFADTPLGEAAMAAADARQPRDPTDWPTPFAEQPVHSPRPRKRSRKVLFDEQHPQGTA